MPLKRKRGHTHTQTQKKKEKMVNSNRKIKLKRLCNFDAFYVLYVHQQQVMNNSTLNIHIRLSVEKARIQKKGRQKKLKWTI